MPLVAHMKRSSKAAAAVLSCALSGALVAVGFALPLPAQATGEASGGQSQNEAQTSDAVSDLERQVQESASTYDAAVAYQDELASQISALNGTIAELEEKLPAQQEQCDESLVALYKYSYDSGSIVQMLIDSKSIIDMLTLVDQYNWVIDHHLGEIMQTAQMKSDLESSRTQLASDKAAADTAASDAASALSAAKAARQKAAEEAAAKQKAEAEAAAKQKQDAEQKVAAAQQSGDAQAQAQAQSEMAAAEAAEQAGGGSGSSSGNVDWSADKTAFVNEWAARIDDYLSGSPTAGTGKYYAAAAWDNGVDPRWAPAISCIESTKGAYCFRSHNAWGYGSSGFSSWEEGINTVVRGLGGSLYGGHLTQEAARTYCPPTWQDWYANVSAEMSKI